jgi:hypothetical protein
LTALKATDKKCYVYSIENAVTVDIASRIKGIRLVRARRVAVDKRVITPLEIGDAINHVNAVSRVIAVDIAGRILWHPVDLNIAQIAS